MVDENKTKAETYLQILAYLYSKGKSWNHIDDIITNAKISSQNPLRLKNSLDSLVKRKIISIWDSERMKFSEQERAKIEREHDIRGINYYKITDLGIEKFDKIRNSCLDDETRIILKIRDNLDLD